MMQGRPKIQPTLDRIPSPQNSRECFWVEHLSNVRRHLSAIRPANQWTYPYYLGRVFLSFDEEVTTLHHQPRRNVLKEPF